MTKKDDKPKVVRLSASLSGRGGSGQQPTPTTLEEKFERMVTYVDDLESRISLLEKRNLQLLRILREHLDGHAEET